MKTFASAVLLATSGALLAVASPVEPTVGNSTASNGIRPLAATGRPVRRYAAHYVDIPGDDIGNWKVPPTNGAWGNCEALCASNEDCYCSTWTSYNGGTCWLKGYNCIYTKGKPTKDLVYSVMWLTADEAVNYTTKEAENCDLPGQDVGSAASGSLYACIQQCKAKLGCSKATYTDYNGDTCWFKRSDYGQECTYKKGVDSTLLFF